MDLNDPEYIDNSSDDDTLSVTPSVPSSTVSSLSSSDSTVHLIENITEDDISDIIIDIYNQISDYLTDNVLELASPTFYEDMYSKIAFILYYEWLEFELYTDDIFDNSESSKVEDSEFYQEIYEFVEHIGELYFDFSEVPLRTIFYDHLKNIIECSPDDEYKTLISNKIDELKSIKQPAQRTLEWFEFRHNLISASSISKVFGSDAQQNQLIYEKCQPLNYNSVNNQRTNINSPLHWGTKYEPVTVMIYEHMFHTKVGEFGCIQHSDYHFIGASPEGINIDPNSPRFGRMLEIKNIVNREITGIPKREYWVQTQIQMETCDLEYCDFMETAFKEYESSVDFYADDEHEYRGIILHFIEQDTKSPTVNIPVYKYMPLEIPIDKESIKEWIQETRNTAKSEGLVLFTTNYWYLQEYSCVLIPRNRPWFQAAAPLIQNIWKTIEHERVNGYEHRASKKKELKNTIVTSDISSNSYFIKNLKQNNGICLIKLEGTEGSL